ncbi:MAG TPA: hypothetical protein VF199_09040 [Bacillales bacterium]
MKHRKPQDIPHSSFFGRWRIGEDFFERHDFHSGNGESLEGLVDDFSVYHRKDFLPERLHPEVVAFYEDTLRYDLYADVRWPGIFRFLSPLYKWFSKRIGQINLPLNHEKEGQMFSRILPLDSEKDGRPRVRAWIRTNDQKETIFVAAYSLHTFHEETYMNIALPLPFGNMTGVLRLAHSDSNSLVKDGLQLTSLPRRNGRGDEGIYYHTRWFSFRLPIQEHFLVWYSDERKGLRASHKMWMFGLLFLTIDYEIFRKTM